MLPLHVANQIAAGEVVERPASVVKELVENAVDSGAERIEVTVTAGGRKLVSVADDGCGMVRDDAILAIERQATSKIRQAEDIEHISTLGFRGEALPSIASVSRFLLRTRTSASDVGTEVEVVGGTLRDVRDCGCPVGTTVEVRDLFFNLPARRKFLRTYQTEQAHIRAQFIVQALANPALAFNLRSDGDYLHRLPACEVFEDRLRDIYGNERIGQLRKVEGGSRNILVTGYVALPSWTRKDRSEQFIFVNKRPTSAPLLYHALREAYPAIEGDRKPALFLFVDLPPALVDVNVHPTKREVRFRRPAEVRDAVRLAVEQALESGVAGRIAPAITAAADLQPESQTLTGDQIQPSESRFQAEDTAPVPAAPRLNPVQNLPFAQSELSRRKRPLSPEDSPGTQATIAAPENAPWAWCRDLGPLGEQYILLETDEGLVVLDPRAAHARVLYERLLREDAAHPSLSQQLLLPQSVELPPADAQRVRSYMRVFQSMGFGISEQDADAFLIDALPDILADSSCRTLLIDIASAIEQAGPRKGRERWREETIAGAAAFSASRALIQLDAAARTDLIAGLLTCRMPYTCPRGKPTMVFTSYQELARRFGTN